MIRFEEAMKLTKKEVYELSLSHLNPLRLTHMNLPYYVKAEGEYVWDDNGNRYLDMTGSIGVQAVGNNNPSIIAKLISILQNKIPGIQAAALHPFAAAFASNLAELSPGSLSHVWFGNCGTEAVEAALKMVHLGHRHNPRKKRIVSCNNSFHGRTLGSMSLMGEKSWGLYHQKIDNHAFIPFDDISALEAELRKEDVIAFFVEPIQGEAGIIVPHDDYLPRVRELCTKYDAYLICDEIQSGFGRTGKLWAFEHWDIVPDACTFAKGYSAGHIPVGGVLVTDKLWNDSYGSENTFFLHTNTYMEGAMSTAAALASLEELVERDWLKSNIEKGEKLLKHLHELKIKYPKLIAEVRGKGLLLAVVFQENLDCVPDTIEDYLRPGYFTGKIDDLLMNKYHIIGRKAGIQPRMRFLPTFDLSNEDIEYFIASLDKTLAEIMRMMDKM